VRHWNLHEIPTPEGTRSPVVLDSAEGTARAVVIGIAPGQQLGDHQVKEYTFVLVVDGHVQVEAGDASIEATSGTLLRFMPDERRSLSSRDGARILLLLAPWPGLGHYRGGDRG
jgi:quercetin dioxygenase-like cupin family protein